MVWGGAMHLVVFHGMGHCCFPWVANRWVAYERPGRCQNNRRGGNPFRDLVVVILGGWLPFRWWSWPSLLFFHLGFPKAVTGVMAQQESAHNK